MKAVLLFDGYCVLCNKAADYIIANDPEHRIKLAALQSEEGKHLARKMHIPVGHIDSVIMVNKEGWKAYDKAAIAVLQILDRWKLIQIIARFIPSGLRKNIYKLIAKHRYGWFGQRSACRIPSSQEKAHFANMKDIEKLLPNQKKKTQRTE